MRRHVVLALLIAVAACSHHPTISYPKLPEVGDREAAMECAAIEAAVLKTDTVRWVIREDGAYLLTDGEIAAMALGSVAVTALTWVVPPPLSDEGHHALARADRRLLGLLKLKRARGCHPTPTSHPGMTDLQVLDRLLQLDAEKSGGHERRRLDERTRLLDGLRMPPPLAAWP